MHVMSKALLTRVWIVLQGVAGVGLAALVWMLLPDVTGATRLVAVLVVLVAWGALGLLGMLLAMTGRDAIATAREGRETTRDVLRETRAVRDRIAEVLDAVRALVDEAGRQGAVDEARYAELATTLGAIRSEVDDLRERLQHVGTGVEQGGLDTSRGLSAAVVRLDDIVDRLRGRPEAEDRT